MGKGITKDFKQKYPEMFNEYKQAYDDHKVLPGILYPYFENNEIKVINFPTKQHWRSPSKLKYVMIV